MSDFFFKNINKIIELESDPYVFNLFSQIEIKKILEFYNDLPIAVFNKNQNIIKKHWLVGYNLKLDDMIKKKIDTILTNWEFDNMFSKDNAIGIFHESMNPLKLHADTGKNSDSIIYKQMLIPLSNIGETLLFEPRWRNESSSFTIDKNEIKNNYGYNKRTNEHLGTKEFDKQVYKKYLPHEHYENLKGLKVKKIYNWKIGEAFVFDRTFIHCSSTLVQPKIGLTLFFNYKKDNT